MNRTDGGTRRVSRQGAADRIADLLAELRRIRDPKLEPRNDLKRLPQLKRWQAERLETTFADLSERPNYRAAARFFLDDLYGDHDVSWRDRDVQRMLPTLRAWLPESVLWTVGDALELDQLSHCLDLDMAKQLEQILSPRAKITEASYAEAYRRAGDEHRRARQINLMMEVGRELDEIVRKSMVFMMLRVARGPAKAAGLGQLQAFLERGFSAFRAMGSARDFLKAIETRERESMRRLFAGEADPFEVE